MKRTARRVGLFLLVGILFLVVVVNFSTIESRLVCTGHRAGIDETSDPGTPATLFAMVTTYRRWILFWYDHHAMIQWEIQPGGDTGFGYFGSSEFATPISSLDRRETYGTISTLSNRINVKTFRKDRFEGMCYPGTPEIEG